MGAVIVATRYVPRPPDDPGSEIVGSPTSSVLLAALAASIPFPPHYWQANTDDPPTWRGRPGAVNLIQFLPPLPPASGPPAMATVYVPNPPGDEPWVGVSRAQPPNLRQLAASVPFPPSWEGLQNAPSDALWTGSSGGANWILTNTLQIYVGGTTRYIAFEDSPPWVKQAAPANTLLLSIATPQAPFSPSWKGARDAVDDARWTGESGGATWVLTQPPLAPFASSWRTRQAILETDQVWPGPANAGTWLLLNTQLYVGGSTRVIPYEETTPWVRAAAPANLPLLQAAALPFFPKAWRQDHQDFPSALIRSASMSALSLPQQQGKPFAPAKWNQDVDDAAVQNRGAAVAPVLGLAGGNIPVKPPRWGVPGDDSGVWLGRPGNVSVSLQQLLRPPIVPVSWQFWQDDGAPALIRSAPTSAVLRKLAAGTVVIPTRWKFDNDDASFEPGGASSAPSLNLFAALQANVPFKPLYSMPGIDEAVLSVRAFNRGALSLPSSIILNPNYIARGDIRNRTVTKASNHMAQTNPLQPPIDSDVEIETVTFDFGLDVKAGVTITGISSLTCVVWKTLVAGQSDSNPATRLVGSPSIIGSPNSGQPQQAVNQLVGTMVAGLVYRLQCVVTMSDGQTLSLWTHLECDAPD